MRKPFYKQLYFWVLIGMIFGVVVGQCAPDAPRSLSILKYDFVFAPITFTIFGHTFVLSGTDMKVFADAFLRLIKMMIAPIIFTTVVVGMAGMGNLKRIGRIGAKAFIYFEVMTTIALIIGWVVAKTFHPGSGMNADPATLDVKTIQSQLSKVGEHKSFIEHIIPETIVGAFSQGEILQVLFFSVLFGFAMAALGEANRPVIYAIDQIAKALMRMISIIIRLAPLAVFGAMSFTISRFGLQSLVPLGKLMACVYLTCICFILLVLGAILRANGINVLKLIRYFRDELLIVFGTASSESVFPRMMQKLESVGCSKSLVGLVLPSGYAFNLDGSSVYLTMGALFIAQATNTHLTLGQEFAVLFVCLLTSKGAATVVGSAFITLAATLASMKTIPVEGMVLIFGVDWFMAQARSMTNLVGNGAATIIIAKWEKEFDMATAKRVLNEKSPDLPTNPPEEKPESMMV